MEGFVAHKLNEFETGKISRRKLIEALTLVATAGASGAASAQTAAPALKVALVNHISYTVPDFKQTADWFTKVFNLEQVGATKRDVALPFGKKGDKPLGVTANDVPLTHLIIRSRDQNAPALASNAPPKPKSQAVIDHICLTVADYDTRRIQAELKTMGIEARGNPGPNNMFIVDPNGYPIQLAGLRSNALSGGAN
jgi:catechol 2,3-dioxygenase-like lactoylglutathione lyase family enzyme